MKVLAAAGEWTRLMAYCDRHELIMKHMFFAYFYVNGLYKKKLFLDILKLKLGTGVGHFHISCFFNRSRFCGIACKVESFSVTEEILVSHYRFNEFAGILNIQLGIFEGSVS